MKTKFLSLIAAVLLTLSGPVKYCTRFLGIYTVIICAGYINGDWYFFRLSKTFPWHYNLYCRK